MILQRKSTEIFSKLMPRRLQSYLEQANWSRVGVIGEKAQLWETYSSETKPSCIQAILPIDTSLDDYGLRIAELVFTIARAESRPFDCILADLQGLSDDTLRLTLLENEAGGFKFSNAPILMKRSLDMISAAANAELEPKSVYRSRHPKKVQEYIDSLRLGHTEKGSFIVKILSAVPPALISEESGTEYEEEQPFSRRVMFRLSKMLNKAVIAASQEDTAAFNEAVNDGVSANFCDALADVVLMSGCPSLKVDFSWSPARKLSEQVHNRVRVPKELAEVLKEASKFLRERVPEKNSEIIGYVIRLEKENQATQGKIVLVDMSEEQRRNISIILNEDHYSKALRAHSKGYEVVVTGGNLEMKHNRWELKNPLGFDVSATDS